MTCVHCGRNCGDYLGGLGRVGDAPLCHPNERMRPDCYRLVTVYGHQLADCPKCKLSDQSKALLAPTAS